MTTLQPLKLTGSQTAEWDRVVTALTFHYPAFNHLLHSLLDHAGQEQVALFTDQIPLAATDGRSLLLNPEPFFGADLDLSNRLFVTNHEVLHNVFEHIVMGYNFKKLGRVDYKDGTSLPYDHKLMNMAQDYIINAILIAGGIGKMPTGQWAGLYDPIITADGDADLLDVYRKLYKSEGGKGRGKGEGEGEDGQGHGGGFCQHQDLGSAKGKSEAQAAAEHNPQAVQSAIVAAANAARAMGKLPAGLARVLDKLVEPTVNWREHVRALLMRKAGSGGYDFQRPDDELMVRDIFAPSRSGHGVGTVVCVVDTSGSVSQSDYDLFYGEVAGVLDDVRPRKLHVIWCDQQVNKSDEIDNPMELREAKINAGGGTDFRPAFDEVARLGLTPDCLIYLTDGLGRFPDQAPSYHTIWGSIYEPAKYPFGDVVQIPKQAA